jgi:hypothetical protein
MSARSANPWEEDPELLAVYSQKQEAYFGPEPLAEGAHDWPAWTASKARVLAPRSPLRGWHMWTVLGDDDSPRLCAPFITALWGATLNTPGVIWVPGVNAASTHGCPKRLHGQHPLISCRCGIRAVQSLTVLRAFAAASERRIGPLIAYAEVDVWGKVAPLIPDDDWRHTIRAEFARIVGPLHLASSHAALADALARHYGIEVQS